MILLPAIDLFEGKAVRLLRGNYKQMTVYGEPLELAEAFVSQARNICIWWIWRAQRAGKRRTSRS